MESRAEHIRTNYGPGTNAGFGQRTLAFFVDGAIADLLGAAIFREYPLTGWHAAMPAVFFLAIELIFVGLIGQTPGMRLLRIGVIKADHSGRAGIQWIALRTLLLATVIPAIMTDSEGRAVHDKAAGTAIIRTGKPQRNTEL